MKAIVFLIAMLAFVIMLNAQSTGGLNRGNTTKYFNGFQHAKNDPAKISLALSYAQELAKEAPVSLQNLLHDHYAQAFGKPIRGKLDNATERKLLDRLVKDTNRVLVETIKPIHLWVRVQENENNPAALVALTNDFMATELSTVDPYPNRVARYALLIYQLIYEKRACQQVAHNLLSKTLVALGHAVRNYSPTLNATRDEKRAHLRYVYAYGNFLRAQQAEKEGDTKQAQTFYQTAAAYSPDLLDQNSRSGYGYDVVSLTGSDQKDGFKEDYLRFLTSTPENTENLKNLTALSITDPVNIAHLKTFYQHHHSDKEPFNQYWEEALNKALSPASPFDLVQLDGRAFSLDAHRGKWVLIDFWGTWCSPCLEEMPQLQSSHREITSQYADKISFLTVACQDTEPKVKTFLNKNGYRLPVAMSNDTIEKNYAITNYPTKVLITPRGKQIIIPLGEDWLERVKLYCEL